MGHVSALNENCSDFVGKIRKNSSSNVGEGCISWKESEILGIISMRHFFRGYADTQWDLAARYFASSSPQGCQ